MTPNPYDSPSPSTGAEGAPGSQIEERLLRYDVAFDDVMHFQKFHFAHSPTMRKQRLHMTLFTSIVIVVLCLIAFQRLAIPLRIGIAVPLILLNSVAIYFFLKWGIARQTRKMLNEGSNDGILGRHELHLEPGFLAERTDVNETRHAYSAIVRIEDTPDYVFIYVSALQAHVVPKRAISYGNPSRFVNTIRDLAGAGAVCGR